jgi:predicted phosphodiesterase
VVVLAGDIANGTAGIEWAKRTFRSPVLYLAGNHEYYDGEFGEVRRAMRDAASRSDVEILDCSEFILEGVRFLGCTLWSDYSLVAAAERRAAIESARRLNPDYLLIRHGGRTFAPEDAIELCAQHRDWLRSRLEAPFSGKTVVVTHFAPHPRSIAPAFAGHPANPGFVLDLETMMGRAALWIHGHTHTAFDYAVNGTRVVCNPRGYPGERTDFRPAWVIDV